MKRKKRCLQCNANELAVKVSSASSNSCMQFWYHRRKRLVQWPLNRYINIQRKIVVFFGSRNIIFTSHFWMSMKLNGMHFSLCTNYDFNLRPARFLVCSAYLNYDTEKSRNYCECWIRFLSIHASSISIVSMLWWYGSWIPLSPQNVSHENRPICVFQILLNNTKFFKQCTKILECSLSLSFCLFRILLYLFGVIVWCIGHRAVVIQNMYKEQRENAALGLLECPLCLWNAIHWDIPFV